jgi:2-dehydropantoate 2-reductase
VNGDAYRVAILGVGGVGGFLAGALQRAGTPVTVVARESTAELIGRRGVQVRSVRLGDFVEHPRAVAVLTEAPDALIVATKATSLRDALPRIECEPPLVLPLLNGLDHLTVLRERFPTSPGAPARVPAGAIRIEADRPEPGVAVHTSPFLRIDMASDDPAAGPALQALADTLSVAEVPVKVLDSEAQVLWSKLVRLNALACTTSAFDLLLGPIRTSPELRAELVGAVAEAAAVAVAEGADVRVDHVLGELDAAHATLGSSMARDIAEGRPPELDAIPGAVLRAAARHDLECPTIERLVALIVRRTALPAPVV